MVRWFSFSASLLIVILGLMPAGCYAYELESADLPALLMALDALHGYHAPLQDQAATAMTAQRPESRSSNSVPHQRGQFLAGAATVDMTPPLGVPLAGYGGRFILSNPPDVTDDPSHYSTLFQPNHGAHDRLMAGVLVLSDGQSQIGFVTLDAIGVTGDFHDALAGRLSDIGFSVENLMVSASHSHSGPGAITLEPLWWIASGDFYQEAIQTFLLDRLEGAIRAAVASMTPAAIGFGTATTTDLTHNRRGLSDWDQVVRVMRIDDAGTSLPMAVLFNFAIHGTCLDADNLLYTGDVPGEARRMVAEALGDGVTVLFTNGIQGDVSPNQSGWDGMENIGLALANYVVQTTAQIQTVAEGTIGYAAHLVNLPVPYIRPGLDYSGIPLDWTISLDGLLYAEALFQAFLINDQLFASFPGEPITPVGRIIQQGVSGQGYPEPFIVACADHHKGYVVTDVEYWNGGYESLACFFGPEAGQIFSDASLAVIGDVIGAAAP